MARERNPEGGEWGKSQGGCGRRRGAQVKRKRHVFRRSHLRTVITIVVVVGAVVIYVYVVVVVVVR